jgi:hypothetical protein
MANSCRVESRPGAVKNDGPTAAIEDATDSRDIKRKPEDLALNGKPPALIVVDQDALFAELLSQDPVFR